jgi:hypothetical protein
VQIVAVGSGRLAENVLETGGSGLIEGSAPAAAGSNSVAVVVQCWELDHAHANLRAEGLARSGG